MTVGKETGIRVHSSGDIRWVQTNSRKKGAVNMDDGNIASRHREGCSQTDSSAYEIEDDGDLIIFSNC